MGGLAAASTLTRAGVEVNVYEQAPQFARVGAGIQMLPNSSRVLRGIGVEEKLRKIAFEPYSHLNRVWDTGEIKRELPMPESLYGTPFLCMHRADLHDALYSVLPPQIVHLGKKLVGLDQANGGVTLSFADGTRVTADAVIGADGVHSRVREIIIGPDAPIHRGRIAYRAVFDAKLMNGGEIGPSRTKWWGPDRHIVIYYTTRRPQPALFRHQRAGAGGMADARNPGPPKATCSELRAAYEGFHPEVRMVLDACPECHNGRSSSAIRCRAGATGGSCCSATPATR